MTSTDIIKKLEFAHKLQNKRKTILIEGNWGIGKTYSYKEFIKKNNLKDIYISLFNILDINEIDKKIIVKYFLKDNNKTFENIKIKTENIINKFLDKITGVNLNDIFEVLDINALEFSKDTIICFDDLERLNDNLNLKNIFGKIEQLHNKVTIVIICNTEKLLEENKKIFDEYKEKVIDNIYQMRELDSDFIIEFIKELNLKTESQKFLIDFFLENGNNNLRYLQRIKDNYEELKLTCENAGWFFDYEKDILEGISCLEAEKCFQTYSNKNLKSLKKIEEFFKEPNSRRQSKKEEELKKEVDFLEEIYGDTRKIVELLNLYSVKNIDIKKELEKYFSNKKIYEEYYQLCYLDFLKGEEEILDSFKKLKAIFNKKFDKLTEKDKYNGLIVLNRYKEDLSIELSLNEEKRKMIDYIKKLIRERGEIYWNFRSGVHLNEFNLEKEKNILLALEEEAKKEIKKENEDKILELISNKKFEKIKKLKNKSIKVSSYNTVKKFFDILLYKSCPYEYWEYYDDIFHILDAELKKEIIEKINENIKNNKSYIIKMRNQYLRNNLKRDHFI